MSGSTNLTLEQARHTYRGEVPWEIDSKDLPIINRARQEYWNQHGSLLKGSVERVIHDRLWNAATKGK